MQPGSLGVRNKSFKSSCIAYLYIACEHKRDIFSQLKKQKKTNQIYACLFCNVFVTRVYS